LCSRVSSWCPDKCCIIATVGDGSSSSSSSIDFFMPASFGYLLCQDTYLLLMAMVYDDKQGRHMTSPLLLCG
jgi:hypothetical protein